SPQFGCTDVGGAYVGPTQTHILRLARELGLETYPVDHTQSSLLELQGTVRPFRGVIPPVYNPIGLLDLSNTMATVDKMASKIPRECPWEYPGAQELDSITAKELMERITWTGYGGGGGH
ncbi:amine oxidase [flavin-containing] A-like, partial [Chiloscyllium plagiosum]|uniref:amine oxidase [flavin-containing] A-like n=1 Tax=Chiloscyllium plagiosum TaxID=36176 RepID=UPI001CB7B199